MLSGWDLKIGTIMTKNVVTLSKEDTVLAASLKMTDHKISGAPVLDENNNLVGMLTEADVLRSMKTTTKTLHLVYPSLSGIGVSFREGKTEKEALEAYREVENLTVKDIMTRDVHTASPDDELRDVIGTMVKKGINRLPVVDGKGALIGIITRGDILRGIAEERKNNRQ